MHEPRAAIPPGTPEALRADGRYQDCTGDCGDYGVYCCDGGWDVTRGHTKGEDGVWMPTETLAAYFDRTKNEKRLSLLRLVRRGR